MWQNNVLLVRIFPTMRGSVTRNKLEKGTDAGYKYCNDGAQRSFQMSFHCWSKSIRKTRTMTYLIPKQKTTIRRDIMFFVLRCLFHHRRDKRAVQWDSFKFEKSVATLKTNIWKSIEKYTFMTEYYVAPRRPDD